MDDLLKYLDLLKKSSLHRADAKANEGGRYYWVEMSPTIRNQYFSIKPRHCIAPSVEAKQEFVIRRMNTDGIYIELFSVDVRRTDSKDFILALATWMIEKWLDEEAYNHEERVRLYGEPFVERADRIDLMEPARSAAKNARAEAPETASF